MDSNNIHLIRKKNGFTLIEALVAMAILTIIIAVSFNLLFSALKARNMSRERLQATETASSIIDEIKSFRCSWGGNPDGLKTWIVSNGFTADATNTNFSKVIRDSNNISYTAKVTIKNDAGIAGLLDIYVTVQSPNAAQINVETLLRGV